ncbi:YdeI/OmpD-associated family protein [Membranihabitans maritimus]|uniref:YdeI/OmpD-associated family protein n=1 Tax=Membranihabitans maritimus TaxID=2904244 RepID=UPI001F2E9FBE|nr:YdeI/OmpD-associated family protein [Membranihabitans maritimus]
MSKKEIETYCPKNQSEWRKWLTKNHRSKKSVWLMYFRVSSQVPSVSWSEAVDEALCFGWIDSTKKSIDEERYIQYFSKRKPTSTWSKINKEKVSKLIQQGRMTDAGYETIRTAKQNGTWSIMDDIENLIIPKELKIALGENNIAKNYFESQSKSTMKGMLYWIVIAKRKETRQKRIDEIVRLASQGKRPKQFE